MVGSEDPLQKIFLKAYFVQEGSSGNTFFDHGQFEIKTFPIYAPPYYTSRFGNFILYFNFLTTSIKFHKRIHYQKEKFHKEDNGDINFFYQKSRFFEKNHEKHVLGHFFSKQATKKMIFLKLLWNCFIDLKT